MGVVHVVQVFCLAQLMSVVCEMRGVDGECEVCMCLVRVGVCGVVGERIGFGLSQSCGNRGSGGRMSVFGLR